VQKHREKELPLFRRLVSMLHTRYHPVWAPKYRKRELKEKGRNTENELFKEILAA